MKRFFLLLFVSLLLSNCGNTMQRFTKVKYQHDTFKQEDINIYEFNSYAYSIWNKHRWHEVFLQVLKVDSPIKTTYKIYLNFDVSLNSKVQDTIYFKLDNEIYEVPIFKINYTKKHKQSSSTETEIVKESNEKKDADPKQIETVITTTNTSQHDYLQTKILCILPNKLVNKINQSNKIQIRFYENDEGYTLKLNKFYTNKIKEVFK